MVKLVTTEGTYYDEGIYTVTGTKTEKIPKKKMMQLMIQKIMKIQIKKKKIT